MKNVHNSQLARANINIHIEEVSRKYIPHRQITGQSEREKKVFFGSTRETYFFIIYAITKDKNNPQAFFPLFHILISSHDFFEL